MRRRCPPMRRVTAATALMVATLCACQARAEADEKNTVPTGPGYRQSVWSLSFSVPPGWAEDQHAAKRLGLYSVLVPEGQTIDTAKAAITVVFKKYDPNSAGPENLWRFYRGDFPRSLPIEKPVRWRPSGHDAGHLPFMSVEYYITEGPSPNRVAILDSGDGVFIVTLTGESLAEVVRPEYDRFFDSLALE